MKLWIIILSTVGLTLLVEYIALLVIVGVGAYGSFGGM